MLLNSNIVKSHVTKSHLRKKKKNSLKHFKKFFHSLKYTLTLIFNVFLLVNSITSFQKIIDIYIFTRTIFFIEMKLKHILWFENLFNSITKLIMIGKSFSPLFFYTYIYIWQLKKYFLKSLFFTEKNWIKSMHLKERFDKILLCRNKSFLFAQGKSNNYSNKENIDFLPFLSSFVPFWLIFSSEIIVIIRM